MIRESESGSPPQAALLPSAAALAPRGSLARRLSPRAFAPRFRPRVFANAPNPQRLPGVRCELCVFAAL